MWHSTLSRCLHWDMAGQTVTTLEPVLPGTASPRQRQGAGTSQTMSRNASRAPPSASPASLQGGADGSTCCCSTSLPPQHRGNYRESLPTMTPVIGGS